MSPQLVGISGERKGDSWPVSQAGLPVGRGSDCDVILTDASVSRRHCRVFSRDGEVWIEDLLALHKMACLLGQAANSEVQEGCVWRPAERDYAKTESVPSPFDSQRNYLDGIIDMDFHCPYATTSGESRVDPNPTETATCNPAHGAALLHIRQLTPRSDREFESRRR